jgi:hypothetical protein
MHPRHVACSAVLQNDKEDTAMKAVPLSKNPPFLQLWRFVLYHYNVAGDPLMRALPFFSKYVCPQHMEICALSQK